jgi:hypothetical protein
VFPGSILTRSVRIYGDTEWTVPVTSPRAGEPEILTLARQDKLH